MTDPRAVLDRADRFLAGSPKTRAIHARRRGQGQDSLRERELRARIAQSHDVGPLFRAARAEARQNGQDELAAELASRSLAVQRERRYLRRMLDRTR